MLYRGFGDVESIFVIIGAASATARVTIIENNSDIVVVLCSCDLMENPPQRTIGNTVTWGASSSSQDSSCGHIISDPAIRCFHLCAMASKCEGHSVLRAYSVVLEELGFQRVEDAFTRSSFISEEEDVFLGDMQRCRQMVSIGFCIGDTTADILDPGRHILLG